MARALTPLPLLTQRALTAAPGALTDLQTAFNAALAKVDDTLKTISAPSLDVAYADAPATSVPAHALPLVASSTTVATAALACATVNGSQEPFDAT